MSGVDICIQFLTWSCQTSDTAASSVTSPRLCPAQAPAQTVSKEGKRPPSTKPKPQLG